MAEKSGAKYRQEIQQVGLYSSAPFGRMSYYSFCLHGYVLMLWRTVTLASRAKCCAQLIEPLQIMVLCLA